MTEQLRSRMKGCLVMPSYIFTYFPTVHERNESDNKVEPKQKKQKLEDGE